MNHKLKRQVQRIYAYVVVSNNLTEHDEYIIFKKGKKIDAEIIATFSRME